MSYTSFPFMLFVAATALVYFLLPAKTYRWTVLLAASLVFYMIAGYRYAAFLLFTAFSTYACALWVDSINRQAKEELKAHKADWDKACKKEYKARMKTKKQKVMLLAVIANLGILCFLKYYNFFAGSLNDVLGVFAVKVQAPSLKLFLPLGISFYTFQSVGYVIDVYREKVSAQRNFAKVLLFVSFFPQIIQGPISFYDQLAHQLYEPHDFDFTRCKYAGELILWGFFKKLVIADRAVIAINSVLDAYGDFGGTTLTFTVLLYALQLYADFSGGIDISRGVAELFGIRMTENFKRPYFATTINDYWRRWHISLGAWMKEYVFYPLAISKSFTSAGKKIKASKFGTTKAGIHVAKVLPTSFASLIVFFLVGVWHGANWKYVAFGIWNGGIIMLSTLLEPWFEAMTRKLRIPTEKLLFRLFQMVRTFVVVAIGYVFDVAPDFSASMMTFRKILFDQNWVSGCREIKGLGLTAADYGILAAGTGILFLVSLYQETHRDASVREMLDQKPFFVRYVLLLATILTLLLLGIYGPGFDAAAFVYMQF